MSEFVIKGKHDGLTVAQAVEFAATFAMSVSGLKRLADDIAGAAKLPPLAKAARIARLEYIRDTAAGHVAWALSLGGMTGNQLDGELARLRSVDEDQYYVEVVDVEARRIAGKRRYALQEYMKLLIAQAEATTDGSPEV